MKAASIEKDQKNGDRINTTESLTRDQALAIFKKNPEVVRINEKGGWWDRRTFINELKHTR